MVMPLLAPSASNNCAVVVLEQETLEQSDMESAGFSMNGANQSPHIAKWRVQGSRGCQEMTQVEAPRTKLR